MEDNDEGRCMHGCYPADIDTVREIARNEGPDRAQEWMDNNQPGGEPYVGANHDESHHRLLKVVAGSQGIPVDTYLATLSILENEYDYEVKKVGEWLQAQPGSQLHQELQQRRQNAEQQINRVLSSLSDLYQQKHMLEHDLRTLEEKRDHFADQDEEALKGDFVDNVDQHTGRSSIIQMQANNVFPSITADFYAMNSLEDLTDGHLSDLPEQEKAVLRKKWKLYQKWKEEFGGAVDQKVEDLQRRLRSVETSIEQTENWIKPYVQTIKQMEGDPEERIGEMTDPYMLEGYASAVRSMKIVAHKPARRHEQDGEKIVTHRDVIVIEVIHLSLGGTEQPQAPGQGSEVVKLNFKEYLVCDHVFDEVFQPQIDERENDVKRYVHSYVGDEVPEDIKKHTDKPFEEYDMPFTKQLQRNVMRWFGLGDAYFHGNLPDLRNGLLGPGFSGGGAPLYIGLKYHVGLYVMK